MTIDGPEKVIFVGGAPRSGTTVTHALICTSESVNNYHPEISFFRSLVLAYPVGKGAWDAHTGAFFADQEEFRQVMRRTTDVALNHAWKTLKQPRILALKDPRLTPLFPALGELYPREAYFLTVVRHPNDVVRSRQQVHEKSGAQRPFSTGDVAAVAREYVSYYGAVLQTNFGGRHFMFRYEDLNDAMLRARLESFVGVNDFDTRKLWRTSADQAPDSAAVINDPWGSPKYYEAINLDRRLSPLSAEWEEAVRTICAPIMTRMGYT